MKIRSGFVSNSSSSSFVIVGVKVDEDTFNKMGGYEFFEDHFKYVDKPEGYDFALVGAKLGRWSGDDGEIFELDLTKVDGLRKEVEESLRKLFPEVTPNVKVIAGTTYG